MADKYNYIISVEEIRPLPNGERFAAKVTRLVRNPGPNHEVLPLVGYEHWGMTYKEAYDKADIEIKAWIASQDGESNAV